MQFARKAFFFQIFKGGAIRAGICRPSSHKQPLAATRLERPLAATCGHLRPLEWLQVAAFLNFKYRWFCNLNALFLLFDMFKIIVFSPNFPILIPLKSSFSLFSHDENPVSNPDLTIQLRSSFPGFPGSTKKPLAETSLRYPVSQLHRPRQCNKSTPELPELCWSSVGSGSRWVGAKI